MEARKTFTSAAHNLSSSSLRKRLTSIHLSTPPIPQVPKPNIAYACLPGCKATWLTSPLLPQVRAMEDTPQTETTDTCSRNMVDDDRVVHVCVASADVRVVLEWPEVACYVCAERMVTPLGRYRHYGHC